MVTFELLIRRIREAYSAIAAKIEELVLLLNEIGMSGDPETKALAGRIVEFLERLEKSIKVGAASARREHKSQQLISLLDKELKVVSQLQAFIQLAARKPTAELITKIHELSREIRKEMEAVRRMA